MASIMLIACETKLAKDLNSEKYLIYYHSPIPLPSISNHYVTVFNNVEGSKYDEYANNENYITIGIKRIKTLSIAEARYLIDLLQKFRNIASDITTEIVNDRKG